MSVENNQTPIEVLLQVDADGNTTAKKLFHHVDVFRAVYPELRYK